MRTDELNIQKKLVETFLELEKEIESTNSTTHKLGYQQRNELISHVYSNYQNHEKLNEKREEWNRSVVKGNVMKWIYELFKSKRDLYGYFEKPNKIKLEIESLLNDAIKSEKFEIAQELNYWLSKIDEKYES